MSPGTVTGGASNASGCLTFRFTSDGGTVQAGWAANISCTVPCQTITASATTTPAESGGITRVCQGGAVTLNGSAVFSSSGAGATFSWRFNDGVTATGATITRSFATAGSYTANLTVRDANSCSSTNTVIKNIQVSTSPVMSTTATPASFCLGAASTLTAAVTMTPFAPTCTPATGSTSSLPDGSGVSYLSSINVNCYAPSQVITTGTDISQFCINMEHSYLGDLNMRLICPNGQSALLHQYPSPANSSYYLGGAIDDVTSGPGTGLNYCFNNTSTVPLYLGATGSRGTPIGTSINAGSYMPTQSFSNLIGCPVNGTWAIEITDNIGSDDGYIFSWDLDFAPSIPLAAGTSFTPTIASSGWVAATGLTAVNATTARVVPTAVGTPCYTYRIVDNFGCTYDAPATCVTAQALPVASISGNSTICNGQSTTLTASGGGTYLWSTGEATAAITVSPGANTTYTVTVTNASNCTSTAQQAVTVNQTPTFTTCPSNISQSAPSNACNAVVTYTAAASGTPVPTISYTFTGATTGTGSGTGSGTTFNRGVSTVTLVANNTCGNATCTFTVSVNDVTPPVITCPANITVSNTAGACSAAVTFAATATDNCVATITYSPASGSTFNVGLTTVTATAVDATGNSASCTFTVRVNDTQAPIITCPANITVSNTAGACTAAVTFAATATDNCYDNALDFDGVNDLVSLSNTVGDFGTSNFTVETRFKTTGTAVGYLIGKRASCGYVNFWNLYINSSGSISAEICGGTIPSYLSLVGTGTFNDGNWHHAALVRNGTTLSIFVDGVLRGSATSSPIVNLSNTANATIGFSSCGYFNGTLDEVRLWTEARSLAQLTTFANSPLVGNEPNLVSYNNFNIGVGNGNNTALTATSSTTGPNGTFSGFALNGASSNLVSLYSGPTTITYAPASGSSFNVGLTTVTATAVDAAGNSASCNFTVRVNDTQAPLITCAPGVTISNTLGQCSGTTTLTSPTVTENCVGNNAVALNGTTGFITTPDVKPLFTTNTTRTIELWFKANAAGVIVDERGQAPPAGGWQDSHIEILSNGNVFVRVWNMTAVLVGNATFGTWNHVVLRYDQSTSRLDGFLNGVQSAGFSTGALQSTSQTYYVLGLGDIQNLGSGAYFNGTVDEFRIWNTARTPAQIVANMNRELGASTAGLVLYYNFNQGIAGGTNTGITSVADASGNNRLGTLANSLLTGTASNWVTGSTGLPASPGGVTITSNAPSTYPVGTTTVTWTATDASGNASTCTQTVRVNDTQAPTITCPTNITVSNTSGACTASVTFAASATDNCGATTITYSPASGSTFNLGLTTVTATAVDATGNVASCTFTVRVNDTQAPLITCAANVTISNTSGLCNGTTTLVQPTVSDNCYLINNALNFDGSNDEIAVNGVNLANQSFTIEFWAKPTAIPSGYQMVIGQGTPANNQGLHIGFRPGNVFTFAQYNNDLDIFSALPDNNWHHWACVFTAAGGSSTQVVYRDGVQVGSRTASSNYTGTGTLLIGDAIWGGNKFNGSVDEVRIWNVARTGTQITNNMGLELSAQAGLRAVYSFNQGVPSGTNTGLTALTDASGNALTGTLSNFALTGATSNWVTGSTGLPASSGGVTITSNAPSTYTVGTTTVTWTATDAAGNASTCTQTVLVNDTQAPSITCPTNITVSNTVGACNASVTFAATATDNCGATTITYSSASGSTFNVGLTTVTATAVDAAGNSASCTFTVRVNDTQAPVITCAPSVTISNSPGLCSGTVTLAAPMVTDNCPLNGNALNFDGVDDRVAVATGLPAMTDFTVECWVNPTLFNGNWRTIFDYDSFVNGALHLQIYPDNRIEFALGGGISAYSTYTVTPNTWQHIAVVFSSTNDYVKFYLNGVLINTVTYTGSVTLNGGAPWHIGSWVNSRYFGGSLDELRIWNTERTTAQIQALRISTLVGNESGLVAYYPFNQGVGGANNAGITTLLDLAPANGTTNGVLNNFALNGNTSNWVPKILTTNDFNNGTDASGTYPLGTTTVTWTTSDAAGNTATCTQTVTVLDNQAPSITCPANVTQNAAAGLCNASVTVPAPTVSDNCSIFNALAMTGGTVATANYSGTNYLGDLTLEAWFNGTTLNGNTLMTRDYTAEFDLTFWGNELKYYNQNGGSYVDIGLSYIFNPNTWYHVAVVRDAAVRTVTLFVNGVQQGTFGYAANPTTVQNMPFYIGRRGAGQNFNGRIDEVRVWNVKRTPAQISANYSNQLVGNEANLQAYYRLNEGVAGANNPGVTQANDQTANLRHATMTGFTLTGLTSNWVAGAPAVTSGLTVTNSFNGSNNASGTYPVGTTTVTWTTSDAAGNTATCTQTVTVNDTQLPVITCPANITVSNIAGACTAAVTFAATATDNCGATTVTYSPASGSTFAAGLTTVTATAVDAAGNSATCTFTVQINDTEAPVITCPAIIIACEGQVVNFTGLQSATATDVCSGSTLTYSPASGSTFTPGITIVTVTAVDASGNSATSTFMVQVNFSTFNAALAQTSDNAQVLNPNCEESGWTYYSDPDNNNYYFAINWAPDGTLSPANGLAKSNAQVQIFLDNNLYGATASAAAGQPAKGTWVMRRAWNVNNASALDEPVGVRFFYDAAELTAIQNAATNFAANNAASGTQVEPLTWFKTIGRPFDPSELTASTNRQINAEGVYVGTSMPLSVANTGTINGIAYVEFSNVPSFSGGGVASGAGANGNPLPVELLYFTGQQEGEKDRLEWATASEQNVARFEVEHSRNGSDFVKIDQTIAVGNSQTAQEYSSYNHAPSLGNNYYRLRTVDEDGSSALSNVINLFRNSDKPSVVSIYPNPTIAGINYEILSAETAKVLVKVIDFTGRVVHEREIEVQAGVNTFSYDCATCTSGAYLLQLYNENGELSTHKFIRN